MKMKITDVLDGIRVANGGFNGYTVETLTERMMKMKIKVTYAENEKEKKAKHEAIVKKLFPDAKVKETAPKDGFLHTVLTIPKPKEYTK